MIPDQLTLPTARGGMGSSGPVTGAPENSVRVSASTPALARASDPVTSHRAAASIGRGVEEAVLGIHDMHAWFRHTHPEIHSVDGFTDDELCAELPHLHSPSVKSARSRLSKRGLLRDSGTTRLSARGKPSIVWEVV